MSSTRMQQYSSKGFRELKPCRDGYDCLLQYDNPIEHNSIYTHPCRWSELCRDMNRNNEHARQFTHNVHQALPCKYGSEDCNKITDPEHRRTYRHEDLPDFLLPCKYKDQCRDRSIDHLKKYGHPSNFYQKINTTKMETVGDRASSRFTHHPSTKMETMDDRASSRFAQHPSTKMETMDDRTSSRFTQHPSTKMETMDDRTSSRFYQHPSTKMETMDDRTSSRFAQHPSTRMETMDDRTSSRFTQHSSTKMETMEDRTSSRFTQHPCRYGIECRNQSDPTHCNRYSHPVTISNLPIQLMNPTTTSRTHRCTTGDDMQQAYRIGAALAIETLSKSDQIAIQNMPADLIIVIPGTYDHIDRVLDNLNIKYITVNANQIGTYPFRNNQTVYINCTSNFPVDAARRLRQEVEKGLHIITTDWALKSVLQVAFSDFIRHNGRATADEVVGIQVADRTHPLINGFLPASKHVEPQWWLETGSHAIEIVNKEQVRVLIRSETLGQKYQSDAVLVTFNCGRGNVIHMISHFYLQRSETRDARHQMSAKQYAMDIKASTAATNLVANQGQNLNYAQIQSSSTSAQFIYNQISTRLNSKN